MTRGGPAVRIEASSTGMPCIVKVALPGDELRVGQAASSMSMTPSPRTLQQRDAA
jgi:hypothetical protein